MKTKTRKKRTEELRADLWAILGPTGSSLLLAVLDHDDQACLALADYFEEQGDEDLARLARSVYPAPGMTRQNMKALYALLCSMPGLKMVCAQERMIRIDLIYQHRRARVSTPAGDLITKTDGSARPAFSAWEPSDIEDPMRSIRDRYDRDIAGMYMACERIGHVTMLFDLGCEGHQVPMDVGSQVVEFRRMLRLRLTERLKTYIQN